MFLSQIFEFCHFVGMTGLMKNIKLPFALPSEGEHRKDNKSSENSDGRSLDLSTGELQQMEIIYKMEIPEFQSLAQLYNMERETARRQRRLKTFPKCLSQRQQEGGPLDPHLQPLLDSIRSGPRTTAITFTQYMTETKRHSHESFYVSRQHSVKWPSVVFFRHPSTRELKFGEVDKIYEHSYVLKEYTWVAVNLYNGKQFHSQSGLWSSENSLGQTLLVLLHHVSHPLTIAIEGSTIWFLDVVPSKGLDY